MGCRYKETRIKKFAVSALSVFSLSRPVHRVLVLGFLGLALTVVPLYVLESLPSISIWQRLFGWSPSTGITRGAWALLHGDVETAVAFNFLSIPAVIIAAGIFAKDCITLMRSRTRAKV